VAVCAPRLRDFLTMSHRQDNALQGLPEAWSGVNVGCYLCMHRMGGCGLLW